MTKSGPARPTRANSARTPTERRNRDDSVMAAATAVMSERGYVATSVQDIADRVGVLKGSLYHYFSSKEDLLYRVMTESHEQSDRIMGEVAALDLGPVEELSEFLRRLSIWYLTNVERANIYFSEGRHLTGARLKETQQRGRKFTQHLKSLITAGQEAGELKSALDPELLTRFVLGALNNVRSWPSRSGKSFTNDEMADAFVSLVRRALEVVE
jgi:AcrR family transcriptional regulator